MTQDLLVDIGEEYILTENLDGETLELGVYNDSSDNLTDTSTYADITSEPTNDNYSPIQVSFSASNIDGNWGIENDSEISLDFSDIVEVPDEIDTAYLRAQFDSSEAGGSGWHLIANPALTQTRRIGSIDTLELAAGDLQIKLD